MALSTRPASYVAPWRADGNCAPLNYWVGLQSDVEQDDVLLVRAGIPKSLCLKVVDRLEWRGWWWGEQQISKDSHFGVLNYWLLLGCLVKYWKTPAAPLRSITAELCIRLGSPEVEFLENCYPCNILRNKSGPVWNQRQRICGFYSFLRILD